VLGTKCSLQLSHRGSLCTNTEYKDAQGRKWLGLSPGDAIQFITSKIKGQGLNRVVKAENVTTRRKGLVVLYVPTTPSVCRRAAVYTHSV
jgi:hypothetical protein